MPAKKLIMILFCSLVSFALITIITCQSKEKPVSEIPPVFLEKSPQVFEPVRTFQAGIVDLDGDGDLDAVLPNMGYNHSQAPVMASHSCVRGLHNKPRNIPDKILKLLASKNGVNMITFDSGHLSAAYSKKVSNAYQEMEKEKKRLEEKLKGNKAELERELKILTERLFQKRVSIEILIDHIDHAVKVAGIDHVGLGSDFGGVTNPMGLEDASGFILITYHLLKRGYEEEGIKKIMGGNLLRLFADVQKTQKINKKED